MSTQIDPRSTGGMQQELCSMVLMQSYLFGKTHDISFANAMDKILEVSGSRIEGRTCAGTLAADAFMKLDAVLPEGVHKEIHHTLAMRHTPQAGEVLPTADDIKAIHEMLMLPIEDDGTRLGRRLRREHLYYFLSDFARKVDAPEAVGMAHGDLLSAVEESLDRTSANIARIEAEELQKTRELVRLYTAVNMGADPLVVAEVAKAFIAKMNPAMEAQLLSTALKFSYLLSVCSIMVMMDRFKNFRLRFEDRLMLNEFKNLHRFLAKESATAAEIRQLESSCRGVLQILEIHRIIKSEMRLI